MLDQFGPATRRWYTYGVRRIAGTLAAVGVILLAAAAPAWGAFPGGNGRLAFVGDTTPTNPDIYTAAADGSDVVQLTSEPGIDRSPAWSADGSRIAFVSNRDGELDIWTMNADGSNARNVTASDVPESQPAWSPSGEIVFVRGECFIRCDIYSINADGSGLTQITDDDAHDSGPAWSPDGRQIVFSSFRVSDGVGDLYLVRPDGSGLAPIASGPPFEMNPNWFPDGTKLAVNSGVIFSINLDGSGLTILEPSNPDDLRPEVSWTDPAWSPAGDSLAYVLRACFIRGCDPPRLRVSNLDASPDTPVSLGYAPDWQPLVPPAPAPNSAAGCKAERERIGDMAFANKYGTNKNGANAFGKCVSGHGA
jgi:WD40 repeat protein